MGESAPLNLLARRGVVCVEAVASLPSSAAAARNAFEWRSTCWFGKRPGLVLRPLSSPSGGFCRRAAGPWRGCEAGSEPPEKPDSSRGAVLERVGATFNQLELLAAEAAAVGGQPGGGTARAAAAATVGHLPRRESDRRLEQQVGGARVPPGRGLEEEGASCRVPGMRDGGGKPAGDEWRRVVKRRRNPSSSGPGGCWRPGRGRGGGESGAHLLISGAEASARSSAREKV